MVDSCASIAHPRAGRQACCGGRGPACIPARMDRRRFRRHSAIQRSGERPALLDELFAELAKLGRSYEVTASTTALATDVRGAGAPGCPTARAAASSGSTQFRQTAAMSAWDRAARGRRDRPMDGDLQNDPSDIASCWRSWTRDTDVVSGGGGGTDRTGEFGRKLPSRTPTGLISFDSPAYAARLRFSLKAYRRDVLRT